MRHIFWLLALMPVGIHFRNPRLPRRSWFERMYRNRRGGRVIHLSDVLINLQQWLYTIVYRVPAASVYMREGRGWITTSLERGADAFRRPP